MKSKALMKAMQRVESWPESAQAVLAEIVLEIEAELEGGVYHASTGELAGIDRGLDSARAGRFATDADVEAVFAKHRRA
jgi:predicted transcriptional regulator